MGTSIKPAPFSNLKLASAIFAFCLLVSRYSIGAEVNYHFPTPGGPDATGNRVNVDLVTWAKITDDINYTYNNAQALCDNKARDPDGIKWQLPTVLQAQSFYENVAMSPKAKISDRRSIWIWTSTPGLDQNTNQVIDLKSGIVDWKGRNSQIKDVNNEAYIPTFVACVKTPGEFDTAGNYFDGKLVWSKISNIPKSLNPGASGECYFKDPAKRGKWVLPKRDQLIGLSTKLNKDKELTDKLQQKGWTLGLTLTAGADIIPVMLVAGGASPPGAPMYPTKWGFTDAAYVACVYEPKIP